LNAKARQVYKFKGRNATYDKFDDEKYVFSYNRNGVSFSAGLTLKF
jgi:hypothetical protein